MAPESLSEKFSNFSNINISYMSLKNVIWKFRICNYFREIFKFREFINTLRIFAKYVFAHCGVIVAELQSRRPGPKQNRR